MLLKTSKHITVVAVRFFTVGQGRYKYRQEKGITNMKKRDTILRC